MTQSLTLHPSPDIPLDPALIQKSRLLRSSRLFSPRNGYDALSEKKLLFLALAGAKPVSAASSSHWLTTERGGKAAPDDPAEVAAFLEHLGLFYELEARESVTIAYVSLRQASLASFLAVRADDAAAGRWYGYPKTAIESFVAGDSMPFDDQQSAEKALGVPLFSTFRLSRRHAAAEIAAMRRWWLILEQYGMTGTA